MSAASSAYALQHRGQESAGIATAQRGHIMAMRDQGLVNQVFDEQRLRALQGDMAVGHVRYSTTGANSWENSQPVWRADRREVALGHNGNLVNAVELHTELRERGVAFRSTSDSEIIGAQYLREVQPGELVSLTERGIETRQVVEGERRAFCVFEHIYFARPDSRLEGNRTHVSRRKMGEILWRESPVQADVVIPVPDSGNPAAAGYSKASGIPQDDGLIKNRYVARTFIQPGQALRRQGLKLKFNPMPEVVSGKRIVV